MPMGRIEARSQRSKTQGQRAPEPPFCRCRKTLGSAGGSQSERRFRRPCHRERFLRLPAWAIERFLQAFFNRSNRSDARAAEPRREGHRRGDDKATWPAPGAVSKMALITFAQTLADVFSKWRAAQRLWYALGTLPGESKSVDHANFGNHLMRKPLRWRKG
jgi:hypothetical protein